LDISIVNVEVDILKSQLLSEHQQVFAHETTNKLPVERKGADALGLQLVKFHKKLVSNLSAILGRPKKSDHSSGLVPCYCNARICALKFQDECMTSGSCKKTIPGDLPILPDDLAMQDFFKFGLELS
jgi:hypothetical protein